MKINWKIRKIRIPKWPIKKKKHINNLKPWLNNLIQIYFSSLVWYTIWSIKNLNACSCQDKCFAWKLVAWKSDIHFKCFNSEWTLTCLNNNCVQIYIYIFFYRVLIFSNRALNKNWPTNKIVFLVTCPESLLLHKNTTWWHSWTDYFVKQHSRRKIWNQLSFCIL